jgi:hypothetical protein
MIQRSSLDRLDPAGLAAWNKATVRLAVAGDGTSIGSALAAALKVIVDFEAIFVAERGRGWLLPTERLGARRLSQQRILFQLLPTPGNWR